MAEFIFMISGVRFGDTLVALANFAQTLHPINNITLHIEEKLTFFYKKLDCFSLHRCNMMGVVKDK